MNGQRRPQPGSAVNFGFARTGPETLHVRPFTRSVRQKRPPRADVTTSVGIVVGIIIIAMYMPMFELLQLVE